MVVGYQVTLSGSTGAQLSEFVGVPAIAGNPPFRQLIFQCAVANVTFGTSALMAAGVGFTLTPTSAPLVLGPFETGPIKLSHIWVLGNGATLNILGVPF